MKSNKTKYKYNYPEQIMLGNMLRHGERAIIAKASGYSKQYVTDVLRGRRANKKIIKLARKALSRRDFQKEVEITQRIISPRKELRKTTNK